MFKISHLSLATIAAAVLAPALFAQTTQKAETGTVIAPYMKPSEIPVEAFFRRPEYVGMSLSPNGRKLAARVPFKGRNNLAVIDLDKRTRAVITAFETVDVGNITWVNNERIFFTAQDGQDVSGRANRRGQFAINIDGNEIRDLSTLRGFQLLSRTFDDSPDLVIATNERARDTADVYRLNTKNGRLKLLSFDSPGRVTAWVIDRNFVPRAAVRIEENVNDGTPPRASVWLRAGEDAKWERIHDLKIGMAGDDFEPLAFDFDNKTMYVATNMPNRDKKAIYKYNTETKQLGELVFEHPLIDVEGGLIFSRTQRKLMGVAYNADMPAIKWFDTDMESAQKMLNATFRDTVNQLASVNEDFSRMLIYAQSDVDPGQYHLYDREKKAVEQIIETRSWLPKNLMSERKFITYKARDGMIIPAWLTIPKGAAARNLPLVIHIHGGPRVRVYGGLDWGRPDAQFLASRGYVVLQPEPRGGPGFGRKHENAGFKRWGLEMQDDLSDGALHLVKEGIVDKNRMCLYGGSYGGYATLQGMVKEPDLFKCGIATVAVSDLTLLQNVTWSDTVETGGGYVFKSTIGDSVIDKDQFEKTSPARNTERVKGPILLAMGSDDVRVPLIHGERMRDGLLQNGKKVEWVVYKGEGHGFNLDANVIDFYTRLERFLAENNK